MARPRTLTAASVPDGQPVVAESRRKPCLLGALPPREIPCHPGSGGPGGVTQGHPWSAIARPEVWVLRASYGSDGGEAPDSKAVRAAVRIAPPPRCGCSTRSSSERPVTR